MLSYYNWQWRQLIDEFWIKGKKCCLYLFFCFGLFINCFTFQDVYGASSHSEMWGLYCTMNTWNILVGMLQILSYKSKMAFLTTQYLNGACTKMHIQEISFTWHNLPESSESVLQQNLHGSRGCPRCSECPSFEWTVM